MENNIHDRQVVLNTKEAAKYLNVSVASLNNWRSQKTKDLKYLKIGRCCKYLLKDLNEFLDSMVQNDKN